MPPARPATSDLSSVVKKGKSASRATNQPRPSGRKETPKRNEYFVPRDGIDREVISADICRYLGNDVLVRPGMYENPSNGEVMEGYYITCYRNLTTAIVEDLKADSARWENERRAQVSRQAYAGSNTVDYHHSETHQSRQHYGPTVPSSQDVLASRPDQGPATSSQHHPDAPKILSYLLPALQAPGNGQLTSSGYTKGTAHRPEADLESLTDIESVFSDAPSVLTAESSLAGSPAKSTVDQIQKLAQVLLSNSELKNLCIIAVSRVDRSKWRAHLKGFLTEYSTALKSEASDFLETQVANFVKNKAGSISDAVYKSIASPSEIFDLDQEARIRLESRLADLSMKGKDFSNKGDVESEPGEDGDLRFELTSRLEEFLRQGDAAEGLIQSLRWWLHIPKEPKADIRTTSSSEERPERTLEQVEPADPQPRYVSWVAEQLQSRAAGDLSLHLATTQPWSVSNHVKGAIEGFFGESFDWWPLAPRMKEVPRDKTRLTWTCACDRKRHLDVPSHLVPAIMRKALAQDSYVPAQRAYSISLPPPLQSQTASTKSSGGTDLSSFEMRRLNSSGSRVPGTDPGSDLIPHPNNDDGSGSIETVFAFFIVAANPRVGARNYLAQTQVHIRTLNASEAANPRAQAQHDQPSNDDAFFQWVQQEYSTLRGWFGTNFSFRRYSHCDFYRFKKWDSHMYSPVEQHSFPDSDASSTYHGSYRYDPKPMTPMPPITEDEFYHRYYTCYKPSTWHKLLPFHNCRRRCGSCVKLDYLPLRLASLDCDDAADEYFWGIYAVTEISPLWVLVYATVLIVLPITAPSMVFFFMWLFAWGHEGDLQNAVVPLSLSISVAGLFLGYVALDAWTAGGRTARDKLKVG